MGAAGVAGVVSTEGMAADSIPDPGGARAVSVSVDLDAIACYWRIHALPGAPPERARFAILRRCLPRFAARFARPVRSRLSPACARGGCS